MALLLFDLDGTLYSSRGILPDAYREGIKTYNRDFNASLEVPSDSAIFNQVGKPAPEIYENLFPQLDSSQSAQLQERIFSALLERIQSGNGRLYPGVESVLERLSEDYRLGLVTNAQTRYMESVLKTHGLDDYFQERLCHDDAPNGRKSELVKMSLERFRKPPQKSRMIGDRQSDYRAASRNNVSFIHCVYGYGNPETTPDSPRVERLSELLERDLLPEPSDIPPPAGT